MARRRSQNSSRRTRKRNAQGGSIRFLTHPLQAIKAWIGRGLAALWPKVTARKAEAVGLAFTILGVITLLFLLSPNQSALGSTWLRILRFLFGWGMLVLPLGLVALGLWLLLRTFEAELPQLNSAQLAGTAMLMVGALVLLQVADGRTTMGAALETARSGRGGGLIGAVLLAALVEGFGGPGAGVVLATWTLIAATFAAGRSMPDLLSSVAHAGGAASRAVGELVRPAPSSAPAAAGTQTASAGGESDSAERAAAQKEDIPSPSLSDELADPEWKLPDWSTILEPGEEGSADTSFNRDRARLIEDTLKSFGAPVQVVEINQGPTITQYGVEPDFVESRGGRRTKVKVSKISSLADDLALALAAPSIRVEAPVPGKGYVGIEVPNPHDSLVALHDVMESQAFQRIDSRLRLGLGRDVSGRPVAADLASMPHLLIAGATGSGKSVCINSVISCLLLQNTPAQLRFIMIDPKRVELTMFHDVPHLLAPVVVDLQRVVPVLQWVSRQMDERYQRFSELGVRNIADYNARMRRQDEKELPYLVLIVDELADLMMMAPNETERLVTRLAQLARATGIHLVIATQRPSVDVVTGLIKANFPARIAFAVASSVDSRVILDQAGAERLLGRGDMLFHPPDAAMPKRLKGVYVSDAELNRLLRYWRTESLAERDGSGDPSEPERLPGGAPLKQAPLWEEIEDEVEATDDMFDEAVELVRRRQRASISMLQRRLRIGYTRAARLIDQMERQGIVGPEPGGSKAREVLDYGEIQTESGD